MFDITEKTVEGGRCSVDAAIRRGKRFLSSGQIAYQSTTATRQVQLRCDID
jgi:hypothetical protein